jgi:hypothetical protein
MRNRRVAPAMPMCNPKLANHGQAQLGSIGAVTYCEKEHPSTVVSLPLISARGRVKPVCASLRRPISAPYLRVFGALVLPPAHRGCTRSKPVAGLGDPAWMVIDSWDDAKIAATFGSHVARPPKGAISKM